jgi:hypothetical protein
MVKHFRHFCRSQATIRTLVSSLVSKNMPSYSNRDDNNNHVDSANPSKKQGEKGNVQCANVANDATLVESNQVEVNRDYASNKFAVSTIHT